MNIVLLDRDGTVIQDPVDERVESIDEIELFPDTIEALKLLAKNDFAVIFITNQAGIAEGKISEADFWTIHEEVLRRLEPSGIRILKTYMNSEAAEGASDMRKPGPGMLLQAAKDINFDINDVYIVGDRQSDIDAGVNAGCKGSLLVQTARNQRVVSPNAIYAAPTLHDAVTYIIENN